MIVLPTDDVYRELMSARENEYMRRVCGEVVCCICGAPYKFHPLDKDVISVWPGYELHVLCNGILGKT
jgi:hypothetical protein